MYSCTKQSQWFVAPMHCHNFILLFQCIVLTEVFRYDDFSFFQLILRAFELVQLCDVYVIVNTELSSFSSSILNVSMIVFFSVLFCVTRAKFNNSFGFFFCFSWFFLSVSGIFQVLRHRSVLLIGFYLKNMNQVIL